VNTITDFFGVYRLYRKHGNSPKRAVVAAWHIAIQKLPF
jgi:hypothetical protein